MATFRLVVEFPVGVGAEELRPHLWQLVLRDHGEPRLQGVVHLDLALQGVQLDAAGAGEQEKKYFNALS